MSDASSTGEGLNPRITIEPGRYREIGSGKTVLVVEVNHHLDVDQTIMVWFSRDANQPNEAMGLVEFSKKFARIEG